VPLRDDRRDVKQVDLNGIYSALLAIPSVGQPRDGCRMTGYVVFDDEKKIAEFVRLPYNFKYTQKKMIKLNFPEKLITRLEKGR
jgi:hypothetical protein